MLIQYGHPRSASTFQFKLLCAIMHLKAMQVGKGKDEVLCDFVTSDRWTHLNLQNHPAAPYATVLKTHTDPAQSGGAMKALTKGTGMLFYSSSGPKDQGLSVWRSLATLVQHFGEVNADPKGEVDKYKNLFGLTRSDVETLKMFMETWDVLRLCCGSQQSIWNRLKIHGCSQTPNANDPHQSRNPHCERYNISELESEMRAPGLPTRAGGFTKSKPGACKRAEDRMRSGHDFNDEVFDTEHLGKACNKILREHAKRASARIKRVGQYSREKGGGTGGGRRPGGKKRKGPGGRKKKKQKKKG